MNDTEELEERYHGNEPWSLGNVNRINEYNPAIRKVDIENILAKNEIYTRFKQHRKAQRFSPIYVYKKRELFQADVVFFTDADMIKENNGYRYLFTCIDCFTKMTWVFPLKKNNCDSVMRSFQSIIQICGKKPERLNSDRGSELICKKFAKYLSDLKIFHYLSYSLRKCPIIERFNLTIQNLLYKIMAKNRTLKWTEYLNQAMQIYLHRKHRTIGMSPIKAEQDENEDLVRKNLLIFFQKNSRKKTKPKFSLNDTVRIWSKRRTFQRGYDENFSIEYFTIMEVKTNLPVPRYILQDSNGETLTGAFFEDELVKFTPSDTFDIKILKERKKGRKKEFLVHYIGYPNKMDEWISENKLVKFK